MSRTLEDVVASRIACVLLVGCAPASPAAQTPKDTAPVETPDATAAPAAVVLAWLEPLQPGWNVEADPRIVLWVENRSAKPYRMNRFVAIVPALALEGVDDHGARIPLGPPPIPREFVEADFVTIPPGGTERFSVSAQNLAQLGKGNYHVASRLFSSATLDFEIR